MKVKQPASSAKMNLSGMSKKPQIEKFRDKARELAADESAENFDATLRKFAHGSPKESRKAQEELAELIGQTEKKKR